MILTLFQNNLMHNQSFNLSSIRNAIRLKLSMPYESSKFIMKLPCVTDKTLVQTSAYYES